MSIVLAIPSTIKVRALPALAPYAVALEALWASLGIAGATNGQSNSSYGGLSDSNINEFNLWASRHKLKDGKTVLEHLNDGYSNEIDENSYKQNTDEMRQYVLEYGKIKVKGSVFNEIRTSFYEQFEIPVENGNIEILEHQPLQQKIEFTNYVLYEPLHEKLYGDIPKYSASAETPYVYYLLGDYTTDVMTGVNLLGHWTYSIKYDNKPVHWITEAGVPVVKWRMLEESRTLQSQQLSTNATMEQLNKYYDDLYWYSWIDKLQGKPKPINPFPDLTSTYVLPSKYSLWFNLNGTNSVTIWWEFYGIGKDGSTVKSVYSGMKFRNTATNAEVSVTEDDYITIVTSSVPIQELLFQTRYGIISQAKTATDMTKDVADDDDITILPLPSTIEQDDTVPINPSDVLDVPISKPDTGVIDSPTIGVLDPPALPTMPDFSIPSVLITKFPFCIPWDIYNSIQLFAVPPQTPIMTIPLKFEFQGRTMFDTTLVLDLTPFDGIASFCRWFTTILFTIFLMMGTRKLIFA